MKKFENIKFPPFSIWKSENEAAVSFAVFPVTIHYVPIGESLKILSLIMRITKPFMFRTFEHFLKMSGKDDLTEENYGFITPI